MQTAVANLRAKTKYVCTQKEQVCYWKVISTFCSLSLYTLDILNSMLIKTDVNLPDKTVFSMKIGTSSLNVLLVEYTGWSKL